VLRRAALKGAHRAADFARMTTPQNERRAAARRFRRVSCEIELDGKVHSAVIRDLTPQGLFVMTRFHAAPGTRVLVRMRRPGGEIWEVAATTARRSDGRRAMVSDRGIGLLIEEASLGFHEFCLSLAR